MLSGKTIILLRELAELRVEIAELKHSLANERCANTLLQAAYDALEVRWNKLVEDKAQ